MKKVKIEILHFNFCNGSFCSNGPIYSVRVLAIKNVCKTATFLFLNSFFIALLYLLTLLYLLKKKNFVILISLFLLESERIIV